LTIIVDSSVVVASISDSPEHGRWATDLLTTDDLAAPHLLLVEAADVLRRAALADTMSTDAAATAYAELLRLPVALFPYHALAERVWELRANVTAYDGWYVALAEALNSPLATIDRKLTRAPGSRCRFITPPG
jgi:predicted nucleic acid-binding protein